MKNIITFSIIALLMLTSCSNKEVKTKTLTDLFQISNVDQILETKTDTVKYVKVEKKIYLWDLSEKYLGNGMRHMEIAMYNFNTFNDQKRWHTNGANPSWDYAYAKKGEKIYLPKDANGPGIKSSYETHTYLKKDIDLKDYMIDDVVSVNTNDIKKVSKDNTGLWTSLTNFWNYLGPILGMIILIALALALLYLLYLLLDFLFGRREIMNQTSITESQTKECCDDCKKSDCCENCNPCISLAHSANAFIKASEAGKDVAIDHTHGDLSVSFRSISPEDYLPISIEVRDSNKDTIDEEE